MIGPAAAIRGPLVALDFVTGELDRRFSGRLGEASADKAAGRFASWWVRSSAALGPASGLQAVVEVGALPLLRLCGFQIEHVAVMHHDRHAVATLQSPSGTPVAALVAPWGEDLDLTWRRTVRHGLSSRSRWCLSFNGRSLRITDAARAYARRFVEADLATCRHESGGFRVFWALFRAAAFETRGGHHGRPSLIDEIVDASRQHGARVSTDLRHGVRTALASIEQTLRGRPAEPSHREQALTLIYRILFLLYAEARSLVPLWHPVYRESYSVEALRESIERGETPTGYWEALQAISRMARQGCQWQSLRVTPFNGRLFAPGATPLGERPSLDDGTVRQVLVALTTRPVRGGGRRRVAYGDLGVDELGSIYEWVLDEPPAAPTADLRTSARALAPTSVATEAPAGSPVDSRTGLRNGARAAQARTRKSTGTFYTPRSLTDYLVRRTLSPLTEGRSSAEVLALRVLDPAMGSGALLVAACRHLASAYETALIKEEQFRPGDIGERDRAGFRRLVAQRCLFGVDANPMAVQLARLSLWLATLAVDVPLTFLDHHLRSGDSLVGASPWDLARQASGLARRQMAVVHPLPLFGDDEMERTLARVVPVRLRIAEEPGDSLDALHGKQASLSELDAPSSPLSLAKAVADLWCASWFWPPGDRPPPAAFDELVAAVRGGRCALPSSLRDRWLEDGKAIARRLGCFHWVLEFPEVFAGADGLVRDGSGFDAIIGNPPWGMIRNDAPDEDGRSTALAGAADLARFARAAGIYRTAGAGQINRYQLFVERALSLARPGGRVGLIVPWGLAADHGSAGLRRELFGRCETDAIVGIDNRRAVFPIHRGLRVAIWTATRGGSTTRVRARLGVDDQQVLDTLPGRGGDLGSFPVRLSLELIRRVSGTSLAVPDVRSAEDVALVDRLCSTWPPLASVDGWHVTFGRELNASDDRPHFSESFDGPLIVEGKAVGPFAVDLSRCRLRFDGARLAGSRSLQTAAARQRLCYRDVASATNRQTLIAAMLPPGTLSTHTLFCLKTALALDAQWLLCGLLNSFVVNYLVRLRVTTHVTVALVESLPVPRPDAGDDDARAVGRIAEALSRAPNASGPAFCRLQAHAARLFRLSKEEFAHVISTFPLADETDRRESLLQLANLGVRA